MITKVINSYDLHINGQVLRIVEKNELKVNTGKFKVKELLLNEPRGSKYMNLLTFHEEADKLTVTLDSVTGIENEDILLKSFIASLIDRKRIEDQTEYTIDFQGEERIYSHSELNETTLHDVSQHDELYEVNGKRIKLTETELELNVDNIAAIKAELSNLNDDSYDYLVLNNNGAHAAANSDNDILPYPIIEVISLLNTGMGSVTLTTLNKDRIKIDNGKFKHAYQFVSNSQFYIDDTDIYNEGFIIK